MIMPLANSRDKYTQVLWGIKDFQKRFGRFPEGMWLPETAVDTETLEILAQLGIKFTILAPRQARRIRKFAKGARWQDVSEGRVDPTTAYLCTLPSRRSINLFFYDGPISQDLAFGGLLDDGEGFAKRLLSAFSDQRDWPQIVHIATDGETYGHHHRFGDMALAYCLNLIESQNLAKITNYGEYLEKHPPNYAAQIFENSSWSCIHGVERWRDNCGCHSGMHSGWIQAWRKPLRDAMDGLREKLTPLYEAEASKYLKNSWEARNDYIEVLLDRSRESVGTFLEKHTLRVLSHDEKVRTLKLLEMQKNAMFMFTSCGWFFDEISGIETTQVMHYAARAIQLAEESLGISVEKEYLQILEKTASNIPEFENGAKVYEMFVKSATLDLLRVGAHFAISSLFEDYSESAPIYCYTANREVYDRVEAGRLKLALGRARVISNVTWEEEPISYTVLHLGDHNVSGGAKKFMGEEAFCTMKEEIKEAFDKGDTSEVIRRMDKHFGVNHYTLWHLFKDEQRKVLDLVLRPVFEEAEISFRKMYEENYPLMSFLQSLNMPLPKALSAAAAYMINLDLARIFEKEDLNMERLEGLIKEGKRWSIEIDKRTIGFVTTLWLNRIMERLQEQSEDAGLFEKIEKALALLNALSVEPGLWKAQNAYFSVAKKLHPLMKEKGEKGDEVARHWIELFHKLGDRLDVKAV